MKNYFLRVVRKLILNIHLPGRYLLANIASNILASKDTSYQGKIGFYDVNCYLHDPIQRLIYFGIYEPDETQFLINYLERGDIFFDVGANVGYYSLLASQLVHPDGKVHAFEPIPNNLAILKKAVINNNINNICTNQVAVGSNNGVIKLYIGDEEIGNSSTIKGLERRKEIEAKVITLCDYIQRSQIDKIRLIKIDIEGWEYDALLGMKEILDQPDAPDLIFEINPYFLSCRNILPSDILSFIEDKGYTVYSLRNKDKINNKSNFDSLENLYATKYRIIFHH